MKNILMCLQQLDIGGVETAVVTLCKGYKKQGYNVYVAAKSGVFNKELEKYGIEVLDIEYDISNKIQLDQKEKLKDFCIKNNITEVQIHQYPCVAYWLPVCLELNIPYIAYVHSIVGGAPQWFMKIFPCYKILLPIFFENAYKILCIAESTKKEIQDLFDVNEKKYKIIKNTLYFDDFKSNKVPEKIETFGIAARFAEEKMVSIKNSIDFFKEYSKTNKKAKLLIAGDGPKKSEIEKYIGKNSNVKLLGSVSDMPDFYNKIDLFLGVDRCVIESAVSKCLTIISSYNGTMNILNNETIVNASKVNFSGQNLKNNDNILDKITKLTKKEYKKIVDENYKYMNDNYNVENNLFIEKSSCNYSKDYMKILEATEENMIKMNELEQYVNNINNNKPKNKIRRVCSKIKRHVIKNK